MRRLSLLLLAGLLAAPLYAQNTSSGNTIMNPGFRATPMIVNPSGSCSTGSLVIQTVTQHLWVCNGGSTWVDVGPAGGAFTTPLLGPTGCTTPAYSFTGFTTDGMCHDGTSVTVGNETPATGSYDLGVFGANLAQLLSVTATKSGIVRADGSAGHVELVGDEGVGGGVYAFNAGTGSGTAEVSAASNSGSGTATTTWNIGANGGVVTTMTSTGGTPSNAWTVTDSGSGNSNSTSQTESATTFSDPINPAIDNGTSVGLTGTRWSNIFGRILSFGTSALGGTISHDGTDAVLAVGTGGLSLVGITGTYKFDRTITAAGTTGAQTINKSVGTVNFAAGASSLVVTNSLVNTSSIVFVTVRTNDTTCAFKNAVPIAGSFTINTTAACTAETSFGFLVSN